MKLIPSLYKLIFFLMLGMVWQVQATPTEGGQNDWRTWKSSKGSSIEARLVDRKGTTVVLQKKKGGKKLTLKLSQLSDADQAFIESMPEQAEKKGATTIEGISAEPGKISDEIHCLKLKKWSYRLYLPKQFHTGKKWPVWFILAPSGGGSGGDLDRYKAGANRFGCILAVSIQCKNDFADSDLAMAAMVDDVFDRLPVYESLGFVTGMSGGSRMAYLLAERDKRIAGVLACASGGGIYIKEKKFRQSKQRRSTYIYSLIGTNCFNRYGAVMSHVKFSPECRLRFFPGSHDWARSAYLEQGMARVIGGGLAKNKDRELDPLRKSYAKSMLKLVKELKKDEPWEAAYLAEFLSGFSGDRASQSAAGSILRELRKDPRVLMAKQADAVIWKFSKKYYNQYMGLYEGRERNAKREAEAEKLAAEFLDIPHAKVLRKLGDPS